METTKKRNNFAWDEFLNKEGDIVCVPFSLQNTARVSLHNWCKKHNKKVVTHRRKRTEWDGTAIDVLEITLLGANTHGNKVPNP